MMCSGNRDIICISTPSTSNELYVYYTGSRNLFPNIFILRLESSKIKISGFENVNFLKSIFILESLIRNWFWRLTIHFSFSYRFI